jgi:hypothetical protein
MNHHLLFLAQALPQKNKIEKLKIKITKSKINQELTNLI